LRQDRDGEGGQAVGAEGKEGLGIKEKERRKMKTETGKGGE